jgi:hypothetical protein
MFNPIREAWGRAVYAEREARRTLDADGEASFTLVDRRPRLAQDHIPRFVDMAPL